MMNVLHHKGTKDTKGAVMKPLSDFILCVLCVFVVRLS